jgi:2-polyprenyl-3-methyl-5-hydroxy-6-metoxy-1,4-benzoquinol methylase
LEKLKGKRKNIDLELAHYCHEIGSYDQALQLYSKVMDSASSHSPLLYRNLSNILTAKGQLYSAQKLHFKMMDTVDWVLGKASRFSEWKEIFTESNYCKNCGSLEYNFILQRPDGQSIVSCKNCGFAFLQFIPKSSNIHKLYNKNYYDNEGIYGYRAGFYQEEKSYMFMPRLEWVNKSAIYGEDRRLLDIGCGDGEFLSYAKKSGWKVCGVEISKEGYDLSVKKGIEVYNEELKKISFDDNFFHAITLWDVLEHYISPRDELREIYRILKPGGMVFISTPNHKKAKVLGRNWLGYNASYEHLSYFEASTLAQMLIDIGFKIDTSFSHENNDWNFNNIKGIGHILLMSAVK